MNTDGWTGVATQCASASSCENVTRIHAAAVDPSGRSCSKLECAAPAGMQSLAPLKLGTTITPSPKSCSMGSTSQEAQAQKTAECRKVYAAIDRDADGNISMLEFVEAMHGENPKGAPF